MGWTPKECLEKLRKIKNAYQKRLGPACPGKNSMCQHQGYVYPDSAFCIEVPSPIPVCNLPDNKRRECLFSFEKSGKALKHFKVISFEEYAGRRAARILRRAHVLIYELRKSKKHRTVLEELKKLLETR